MKFSARDAEIIKGHRRLRRLVKEVLRDVGDVFREYNLDEDGITYEQGDYFFLRFFSGDQEVSPGIKLSEKRIVVPVCWVKNDDRCVKLGFQPDPEFKGYMIKSMDIGPEFFELSYKDQKNRIVGFFKEVVSNLAVAGIIQKPGYFIAG